MDIRNEISGGAPSASTKRRWDNIFRYVLNAGTFPVAPIIIRRPEGLSPIDGTHRLAVFSALQMMQAESRTRRLDRCAQGRRASKRLMKMKLFGLHPLQSTGAVSDDI